MGSLASLTVKPLPAPDVRLPTKAVAKRYDVTIRTVERWSDNPALGFPKPIVVNARKYFRLSELEAWESKHEAAVASPPDIERLLQEIGSAATRAEAEAIINGADLDQLDEEQRERVADLLGELPGETS